MDNEQLKIEIELIKPPSTETVFAGWKVTQDKKFADGLCYDEMIGLVTALTLPVDRPALNWMKTQEDHEKWRETLKEDFWR